MVFSSALFLTMFLPIVLGLYFLAQERLRNIVLLFASLLFYSWGEPKAVFIMIGLIVISWIAGLYLAPNPMKQETTVCMFHANDKAYNIARKVILIVAISVNLGTLFFYKYLSFFIENINILMDKLSISSFIDPKIALPIGISFYVFQIISYLVDVYRGEVAPQKSLISLTTYISMFPQLIAGPIVRYQTIAEDLPNRATNFDNVYYGLKRFVIGLAKKVLIADQMAFIADTIFNSPVEQLPCIFAWVGALCYTLQIFYDFSGYSDMAIGLGRIFNFRFLENFEHPYSSFSIKEFWRRWHISLSTWLKDYLYIPLGGNRKGKIRTVINSYIVFALCGLWHGATWNFVVWGLYHGTGLVVEKIGLGKFLEKLPKLLSNLYVWLFVVIGWVIFRAETLAQSIAYLKIMFFGNSHVSIDSFYPATSFLTYSNCLIFFIGILFSYPIAKSLPKKRNYVLRQCSTICLLLLFVATYVFALTSTFSPFIYFRF